MSRRLHAALLLSQLLIGSAAGSPARPIVAVFDIEDRGTRLGDDMLGRLTDYLTSVLGATGAYRVVPRSQIKERLQTQRKESYKSCYDESCQIDIGKELAAQKSLSTQIIKLGSRCMVTAVLFDLRRSASEGGGRAEGGCSEDDITSSIQKIIDQLVPRARAPEPPQVAVARPALQAETVSVDFQSSPVGADVFLNGRYQGRTPFRTDLVKLQPYQVSIERPGYLTATRALVPENRTTVNATLSITDEERRRLADRTEWFAFHFQGALAGGGGGMGGLGVRIATLKWGWFHWSVFDAGGGGPEYFVYAMTMPALALTTGSRRQHQLRLGLGAGFYALSGKYGHTSTPEGLRWEAAEALSFGLAPSFGYTFQTAGKFFAGLEVRCMLPVAGHLPTGREKDAWMSNEFTDRSYPFLLLISPHLGWSASPAR